METKLRSNRGLTMIELMLCVSMSAVLIATVTVQLKNTISRSRDKTRWTTLNELAQATEIFKTQHGYYPVTCCASRGCPGPGVPTSYSSPQNPYFMQYGVCAQQGGPETHANIGEALRPYISDIRDPQSNFPGLARGYVYCSDDGHSYVWHILATPENMHNYPPANWNTRRCPVVDANGQCLDYVNDIMIAQNIPVPWSCN